jgi:ABC-type transport system substrate-binding protein
VEYRAVLNGGFNVWFNVRAGRPFADIRARQAFTYAIDRCDMVNTVSNGAIECEDSVFRHTSPFYDASIFQPNYNPTEAQRLFDQLAAENGGTYKINLSTFNVGDWPAYGQYMQAKLNSYRNVKVNLTLEAVNVHITTNNSAAYDVEGYSNPFDDPEPSWTGIWVCGASTTGWCNTNFDADVANGRNTLDAATRIQAMKDAQKVFYGDLPGFYFQRPSTWFYTTPGVQNLQMANDGFILLDRLWLKR